MMWLYLIIFVIIDCVKIMYVDAGYITENNYTQKENNKGVILPTAAVYVIGFVMLIMLIVILWLLYILYKIKQNGSKDFSNSTIPIEQGDYRNTMTKKFVCTCQEKNEPTSFVNETSEKITNRNIFSSNSALQTYPENSEIKRFTKINKVTAVPTSIILPEQMREICEGVLSKNKLEGERASLKDINKLLNEEEFGETSSLEIERDKSASSPELLELYDEVPKPKPVFAENTNIQRESASEYIVFFEKEDVNKNDEVLAIDKKEVKTK